jgi:hypothetical protein
MEKVKVNRETKDQMEFWDSFFESKPKPGPLPILGDWWIKE